MQYEFMVFIVDGFDPVAAIELFQIAFEHVYSDKRRRLFDGFDHHVDGVGKKPESGAPGLFDYRGVAAPLDQRDFSPCRG